MIALDLNGSNLMSQIAKSDISRGRKLAIGATAAPIAFGLTPAIVTFALLMLTSGGPPVAAVILFIGIIVTALAFLSGLAVSAVLLKRRSVWSRDMRERIAANGIRAEEINWFRKEIKSNEKRALKAVSARDPLLGDAYRETLASRLTATRIVRSATRELVFAKRRHSSLKQLNSARAEDFQAEIAADIEKIEGIKSEAKQMLAEAETRLQMIEAAASREGSLADSELALKKLSARSADLPLALESAKMSREIRSEIEKEMAEPSQ